jgi:hypothetical protein
MFGKKKDSKKDLLTKSRTDSRGSLSSIPVARSGSELSMFVPKETFNSIFLEDMTMADKFTQNQPPSVPDNTLYRPIWVMKLLHAVISKGTFVSPSLFIPKEIW